MKNDEFTMMESQRLNVSVLIKIYQDFKMVKMLLAQRWMLYFNKTSIVDRATFIWIT